jgi:hypothetical protein
LVPVPVLVPVLQMSVLPVLSRLWVKRLRSH